MNYSPGIWLPHMFGNCIDGEACTFSSAVLPVSFGTLLCWTLIVPIGGSILAISWRAAGFIGVY